MNSRFYFLSLVLVLNVLLISISTAKDNALLKEKQLSTEDQNTYQKISKQQYAQCLEQENAINLKIKQLHAQEDELVNQKKILVELRHELDRKKSQLDLHNSASVFAYNQLNQKYSQSSRDYNLAAEKYTQAIKQYHFDIKSLKINCHRKQF